MSVTYGSVNVVKISRAIRRGQLKPDGREFTCLQPRRIQLVLGGQVVRWWSLEKGLRVGIVGDRVTIA